MVHYCSWYDKFARYTPLLVVGLSASPHASLPTFVFHTPTYLRVLVGRVLAGWLVLVVAAVAVLGVQAGEQLQVAWA